MILLLVLACGYPSYYPSPLFPSDTNSPSQEIPCPAATQNLVELHITNARAEGVGITKMEWDCTELVATGLASGEEYTETTHEGMVFIVRDLQGGLVDVLMVPNGASYDWVIQ